MTAVFLAAALLAQPQTPTFPHPDRIRYDGQCFTIENQDTFIFSGAFHYFRCPKELWPARLKAIKEAGFNTVETYVPWNFSERTPPSGPDDFSKIDLSELDDFLTQAEDLGLYTIVRPGPYICAEWATGGFPQWLIAKRPQNPRRKSWVRSDDPEFLRWSKHWLDAVCKVVARHQITAKQPGSKGIILFQIENEYDYFDMPDDAKVAHLRFLAKTALDDGIEIPLFTCWTKQIRQSSDPVLKQVFDTVNEYPRWKIETVKADLDKLQKEQPHAPKMVTELQGGWFSSVGGKLAEEQDGLDASQINALTFEGIATGMTACNYYMLFGGTNFGDWAAQDITTSYDYFSPIREWGGLQEKYDAVSAIGRLVDQYGGELARAVEDTEYKINLGGTNLQMWARKALNGARFLFLHNPSRDAEADGALSLENTIIHYKLPKFGFEVYRLAPDGKSGVWYPETVGSAIVPLGPNPLRITEGTVCYPQPDKWRPASIGKSVAQEGVEGSEFVFYRLTRQAGSRSTHLWLNTFGGDLFTKLPAEARYQNHPVFTWSTGADTAQLLLNNPGYPNFGPDIEAKRGISEVLLSATPLAGTAGAQPPPPTATSVRIDLTTTLTDPPSEAYSLDAAAALPRIERVDRMPLVGARPYLVVRTRVHFQLRPSLHFVWEAVLKAGGDGFLRLNGHALGRYWSQGPQRAFYLPECWLEDDNVLELTAVPSAGDGRIQACAIQGLPR